MGQSTMKNSWDRSVKTWVQEKKSNGIAKIRK